MQQSKIIVTHLSFHKLRERVFPSLSSCLFTFTWWTFVTFWITQWYLLFFLAPVLAQRPRQPHSSTNGSAGTAISEDRNKDRFRNGPLCVRSLQKGKAPATQNCVAFANPCQACSIVTREYHPNIVELLHLLHCIAAFLQRAGFGFWKDIIPRNF